MLKCTTCTLPAYNMELIVHVNVYTIMQIYTVHVSSIITCSSYFYTIIIKSKITCTCTCTCALLTTLTRHVHRPLMYIESQLVHVHVH